MLRLRPYKITDADIIMGWMEKDEDLEIFRRMNEDTLNRPETCFLTAFDDQGVIGFLAMHFLDDQLWNLHVDYMILTPRKRQKGYGRKLLRLAVRFAYEILQIQTFTARFLRKEEKLYRCLSAVGFRENSHSDSTFCEMEIRSLKDMEINQTTMAYEDDAVHEILESNLFNYAFQPIVEAATGDIYGYEALMRAEYNGLVPPNIILEYATRENRLYDVEKATFFNVMSVVSDNLAAFNNRKVFINSIPGNLLNDRDFKKIEKQFAPILSHFVIEVTEETELKDDELDTLLKRSKRNGFGLAIDDYGTGYSNTSSLLRYLPNCVKIDRLLISNIQEDPKKQHFVKSMIEFAHNNGLLALAEGVETSAELKAVIRMGIDLIQGFYTAKPSFDLIQEINPDIRNEMISANVKEQNQNDRKVFVVTDEKELPVMRLALEQYTSIILSEGELTLVGNANYIAGMTIRTKPGSDCRLTLRDVYLESFQDLPCIDIGQDSHLTLVIEGKNSLNKVGICVPEGASLTLEGEGCLEMRVQGVQSYGIGSFWDSGVGSIHIRSVGLLDILVEADEGIGIGGGIYRKGDGIHLHSGTIRVAAASLHAVAIGTVEGDTPIQVEDCSINVELSSDSALGIGNLNGLQNMQIDNSRIRVEGAGSYVTGIGGRCEQGGSIRVHSGRIHVKINGQIVELMGTTGGEPAIDLEDVELILTGEGSDVLGLGARGDQAKLHMKNTRGEINIHAAKFHLLAADQPQLVKESCRLVLKANED